MNPEPLDKVEDKGFFVVTVRVENTHVRIKAGEDTGPLHDAVQNPIAVVKGRVKGVFCRAATSLCESPLVREDIRDRRKIDP